MLRYSAVWKCVSTAENTGKTCGEGRTCVCLWNGKVKRESYEWENVNNTWIELQ